MKQIIFKILQDEFGLPLAPGETDACLDNLEDHFETFDVLEISENADSAATESTQQNQTQTQQTQNENENEESKWKIVGTVGIKRLTDERCELSKMYLASEYRGKKLGKQLLERGLASAKDLKFSQVYIETHSVLAQAVQLYEKYGFKRINVDKFQAARCDQAWIFELNGETGKKNLS